jgi:hypothetical protein
MDLLVNLDVDNLERAIAFYSTGRPSLMGSTTALFAVHVGLRFEARGYGILLNNNSAIFCGGTTGCTVAIKGNALFLGEALAGISARF